ncbi:DUF6233 domain-containing protein [Streptomyces sp. NPDC010273]|uniref:DUF6233 domain-containing protein n=1 Tax=Streptomyces sp. NPDC010273 TaxID=3364829 RepID=UPI0036E3D1E9
MNDLPPDAQRLRAILGHLEQQVATHQAVGIYLHLQREAVRKALAVAEGHNTPAATAPASRQPYRPPPRMKLRPGSYMVEPKIHPKHERLAILHIGGCNRAEREPMECSMEEAQQALRRDDLVEVEACPHCRPDLTL